MRPDMRLRIPCPYDGCRTLQFNFSADRDAFANLLRISDLRRHTSFVHVSVKKSRVTHRPIEHHQSLLRIGNSPRRKAAIDARVI